jgi:hypothetical protein
MNSFLKYQGLIVMTVSLLSLSGCATAPLGPTVQVMPAPGKSFQVFQQEQNECQSWALQSIGGQAAVDKANSDAIATGAVGTIIGTGIGALAGSASGQTGAGAQIGAAGGLAVGASAGANQSMRSTAILQKMYNDSYEQCMYAKGNQVPGMEQGPPHQMMEQGPPPQVYNRSENYSDSGMSNDGDPDLLSAQRALADLGYDPGDIDGYMHRKTKQALRLFQRDNHLPVTGRLDQETFSLLLQN